MAGSDIMAKPEAIETSWSCGPTDANRVLFASVLCDVESELLCTEVSGGIMAHAP